TQVGTRKGHGPHRALASSGWAIPSDRQPWARLLLECLLALELIGDARGCQAALVRSAASDALELARAACVPPRPLECHLGRPGGLRRRFRHPLVSWEGPFGDR